MIYKGCMCFEPESEIDATLSLCLHLIASSSTNAFMRLSVLVVELFYEERI